MKSDIEIKDAIYVVIKGSSLEKAVTGKLKKTKRPTSSDKEDIVISILDNGSGQMQKAFASASTASLHRGVMVSDRIFPG